MSVRQWRKDVYQSTTHLAVAVLLVIMFVLTAYFFTLSRPDRSGKRAEMLAELNFSREYWQTRRPSKYRYVVDRRCVCPEEYLRPYRVTQREGRSTVEYLNPPESNIPDPSESPPNPVALDDLFEKIREAISEADNIDVDYAPGFGYPSAVSIDWSESRSDDDVNFNIRDFEVIEYN